jgi:dihydroxyacetone kinase
VHKVAGHLARAGASLAAVKEAASRAAGGVRSLGLSLSTGTIPGQPTVVRLGPSEVELGLGIHGEPGAETIAYAPVDELAAILAARLERSLPEARAPLAVLINDLGGVPPIEMAVAARAVLRAMARTREVALVFGPERLMTSLDMKGLSVSVLPLDDELTRALLSDVAPRAWPPGRRPEASVPRPLDARVLARAHVPSAHAARRRVVEVVSVTLIALESELDALDARVGDGDTGSTFATAGRAVLAELDHLPFARPEALCQALAELLARVVGGSSGVLLSIGVAAAGVALARCPEEASPDWPRALTEGLLRVQEYGGAIEGDRTMLDALVPAVRALEAGEGMPAAARAARAGADRTAGMTLARAGRSSYVPEDALRGVADPGAVAFAAVFEALARA